MSDGQAAAPLTPLVFLDTETTSLDTLRGDVLEVAWAVGEDGPVQAYALPHTLQGADAEALRINRYYERGLNGYQMLQPTNRCTPLAVLAQDLTGATVVAENYGFDCAMLLRKIGYEPWHYRKIELSSVAMTVFNLPRPEGIASTSRRLREDYGFDIPENDHTAGGDVECLRQCYLALRGLADTSAGYPNLKKENSHG